MSGVRPSAVGKPPTERTARARRMRVARGACWVIVAVLSAVAGLALLDAAVQLPGWVRGLALAVWVTGSGVLAWRLVFRPLGEDPTDEPAPEPRADLPGNLRAASAASLALLACLLAAAFVPGAVDHLRRVAVPWHRSAASPYRVVVTSGEPVVPRGGAVTLTVYVEKADSSAAPPPSAEFVFRSAGRPEERVSAAGDGDAAFHLTRQVLADFEYCVEVGGAVSDWFAVTAIDPVELADGSVTEIVPPRYAPAAKTVRPGFVSPDGLRYGTAEYRLRFNRPVADAYLEFRAAGGPSEITRVVLSADRAAGTASFRLKQDGTLRLVTVAERGGKRLRTEGPAVEVRARPDTPPRFERVTGLSPRPLTARPVDRFAVELVVADDVAVASAVLEWVAPGESRYATIPIPLTPPTGTRATGRIDFDLAAKAAAGETLRFRVRVTDTRKLDDPPLTPQDAVYPEAGWAQVRIDPDSPPLEVQTVTARRDVVREALDAARNEIGTAAVEVGTVTEESAGKPELATDHIARLNNSRENLASAVRALRAAAREAELSPDLRALAAAIRGVADGQLGHADEAARRAAIAPATERPDALVTAGRHLAEAGERVEELAGRNDRLARDRLDARALGVLASEQGTLAGKATGTPPAELLRAQQDMLARFRALLGESAPLRDAADAARQQEFDRLAAAAADLAGSVRDLNDATVSLHAETRARLSAAVTADLTALSAKAAALLTGIDTAARLANAVLPQAEEFRRLAELVADGKSVEALTETARLALVLEALAATFDKWAADRADAKSVARQLALWQDDLRTRFRTATGSNAAKFAALPAAVKTGFRAEQAAVLAATAALRVPPGAGATARAAALEHLAVADTFLAGIGTNADTAMKAAAEQLNRLAESLPSVPERLTKTRPELDKVFREQEAIQAVVDAVFRNSEPAAVARKLPGFADRQRKQVAAFAALDLPWLDARRMRTLAALTAAAADLQAALPQDVPASQAWAKRELDRLRAVLFDNATPPDDKADELALRLREVTTAVEAVAAAYPRWSDGGWSLLASAAESVAFARADVQLKPQAAAVQEVFRQLDKFPPCPEAAALLNDAREAARNADLAFRNGTRPAGVLRKVRVASDDVARLADRLNGAESDHDRLRRLASSRRAAADRAKEGPNPEVARDLAREVEELTYTRVGAAGQALKKRVLAQYARLRDNPAPDRRSNDHAALGEALDELAALIADSDELTATFGRRPAAGVAAESDAFLPSRPLADALRDLARRYRTTRERAARLPDEFLMWTHPADANPLAAVVERQRELAADVAKLAEALAAHVVVFPADPHAAASETALAADRLRNGSVGVGREAASRAAALFRKLSKAEPAREAAKLADRQDAILTELTRLANVPGVAAAQQRDRSAELSRQAGGLVRTLETAARDASPDESAAKTLSDAANTAKAAGRLLASADDKMAAGKVEEASALRDEAEAQLRVAGAKAAGAGPAATTLPALDPETAALGESLRRAALAMAAAVRELGAKPNAASAGKAMRAAADELAKAAKGITDRLAAAAK